MKPHHLALLATVLAVAGCTAGNTAGTSTSVSSTTSTQGRSTATIAQDDDGSSPMVRRVIRRDPNSQTIVQQQGGNSVTIRQGVDEDTEDLEELEDDDW
jgi:hypothetical protein